MLVFVKDHFVSLTAASLRGQRDIALVTGVEEISVDGAHYLASVFRLVRAESAMAAEVEDLRRKRRSDLRIRQDHPGRVAELFEPPCDFASLRLARVADDDEISRSDLDPIVFEGKAPRRLGE